MATPIDPHSPTQRPVSSHDSFPSTGKSTGVGKTPMTRALAIEVLRYYIYELDDPAGWFEIYAPDGSRLGSDLFCMSQALDRLIEDLIPTRDDGSWRDRNGL